MGLAQAGLIRRKNSLSMLMQVLFGMVLGSLLWFICGFSLAFGPSLGDAGVLGDPLHHAFFANVPLDDCLPDLADTIPASLFASFQMMFALMAPLIVTGSWTEKMTFEAFLIFIVAWPLLVYYPLVHWIWSPSGFLNRMGVVDFAGGLTIHSSSGAAGLVVSCLLQRRKPGHSQSSTLGHHNLPLSFVGATLVWSGWYSFNGGSAYKADFQAAHALLNTHLSACAAALVWSLLSHRQTHTWSLVECVSGAFAGLAGITAGSGFVAPIASVPIGMAAGFAGYHSVQFFKERCRLDDVLDVTSLQGTAGVLGSLVVGLFATKDMVPDGSGVDGLVYGGGLDLLQVQALAVLIVLIWSGAWTFVIVYFMKRTVGIDVKPEVEEQGLDMVQIGEQAYDQRLNLVHDLGEEAMIALLNEACSSGDLEEVKTLIRHGADPLGSDYDGRSPVHLAAASGRTSVLDYLYSVHHCDLHCQDKFGRTPMWDAVRNNRGRAVHWLRERGAVIDTESTEMDLFKYCSTGDVDRLQQLIDAGINVNTKDYDSRTPLMVAADDDGYADVVKILLRAGADPAAVDRWGQSAFDSALSGRNSDCYSLLAGTNDGGEEDDFVEDLNTHLLKREKSKELKKKRASISESVRRSSLKVLQSRATSTTVRDLCSAASQGNVEELKRIIATSGAGAASHSDYDHRTPLHLASAGGHLEAVKYLCSLPEVNVNSQDRYHHTPAHEARQNGFLEVLEFLQGQGATTVQRNVGFTLCKTAAEGNISKLEEMLQTGVSLNTCDYDGRTAVHLCASNGHFRVLQWLVANGARVDVMDRFDNFPIDDATREGHKEIEQYLGERTYQQKGSSSRIVSERKFPHPREKSFRSNGSSASSELEQTK